MTEAATPVTGAAEQGSQDTGSAVATAKPKFDPSQFDQAELDAFIESKKHKLRINGQERELSQAELKKLAGLSAASDEKFKSAKQMQAEATELKKAFESKDPVAALKRLGMDQKEIKAVLETKLLEMIEEESLDPRDRELKSYKQKEAEREAEAKRLKDEEEGNKKSQESQRLQQEYENNVVEALKVSGLPASPVIAKSVFQVMLDGAQKGIDIDPKDAVAMVKADYFEQVSKLLPALGVDAVKKLLGADLLKMLREDSVKEVKSSATPFPKPAPRKPESKQSKSDDASDKIGMSAFFRSQRRGGV